MKTLVIIPAYNEQEAILNTISDIKKHGKGFDYVVINDGSSDETEAILKKNKINHITLPVNSGLNVAVETGYVYAYENGYECAIQFDGDGQHQAEYLKPLVEEIKNGANIAIGSRFVTRKKDWSMRMIGSRIISFLIKVKTGVTINDPTSGMRALDRNNIYDYAYDMNSRPEPDSLTRQIKKGYKVKEVQVTIKNRESGTSIYSSAWSSFVYMVKMIISILFIV